MDGHRNTSTFLPPPVDGEASAPLAQPDDDFTAPLSAVGTPNANTPADDGGGTGSTVSPVSPVHLHIVRQQSQMRAADDDDDEEDEDEDEDGRGTAIAGGEGATDDGVGLLPPPVEMRDEEKSRPTVREPVAKKDEDDDRVPVVAMSGMMPAAATGAPSESTTKKNAVGGNDTANGGGGAAATGNGENKSNEKSRYTSGSGAGVGTDPDDSGANGSQSSLGCGTTFEYVVLVTACSILLLAVTGTTVYWTMAYRGGYDPGWFPWPPQTPKQMLSVGVFTYKHPQNFTNAGGDFGTTSTTTTVAPSAERQSNGSSPNVPMEDRRFNLHPTLMTAGFVTLTGFSILVYRMAAGCSTSCRGTYVKLTHGILHLLTVPCVVLGAVASMEYHRLKGLPHLYSLHSWMGVLTVSLFVIQFALGFFTFIVLLCCRGATAACRLRCFAPIHATLGLCTFTLAVATCLTGLQQRADFTLFGNNGRDAESATSEFIRKRLHANKEPLVVNVLAVLLVSVLVVVSYTVRRESIRRRPNNKPSYTASVSPMRVKSSSSTGKFGSGKQSSQPPV